MAGAGNMIADNFSGEALTLSHDGAGKMALKNLDYRTLTVDLDGLGEIQVSGVVEKQTVTIGGAGCYKAEALKSKAAAVLLTGAGEAKVWAEEDLNANITGAGTIKYKGSPKVEQSSSGLGSIKPL
jgi:hypothetical protein